MEGSDIARMEDERMQGWTRSVSGENDLEKVVLLTLPIGTFKASLLGRPHIFLKWKNYLRKIYSIKPVATNGR